MMSLLLYVNINFILKQLGCVSDIFMLLNHWKALFMLKTLDRSISNRRGVRLVFVITMLYKFLYLMQIE